MTLELRPNCECCDVDLPPDSTDARICSFECTFCAACVAEKLHDVCPNCGGGFTPRPIRPAIAWRPGLSVSDHPPSPTRMRLSFTAEEIAAFSRRLRDIPPRDR